MIDPDDETRSAGPEAVLAVWRRRKGLALLVFVASLTAAVSVALSLPNLYRAAATVMVEQQQVSEAFVRPSVTAELGTRIQTIHQQVMSRARLTDVIIRQNLYPELQDIVPMDALVERMRREIQLVFNGVEQTSGHRATIAFTLSYIGRDATTVARVANTLAEFHVEENTAARERQAARTAEFLKEQLTAVRRDLDSKEQRLSDFHLRYSGELPDQTAVNLATLERLNSQLRLNTEYQLRAIERRELLETQVDAGGNGGPRARADTPEGDLEKLKQELLELRRQYSDQYPDVIRVRAAIAALEREIADAAGGRAATPIDPAVRLTQNLREVDRELASLKEEEGSLRRLLAEYDARVESAPRRQQQLQQLSRDYDTLNERYQVLLKRYEEAQLAENLEQGQNVEQFRILDPALPPVQPVAPNRAWLLLMGCVASLALAFGSMLAAERLDTTFHAADEVRAFTNLPLLATIRRIPTQAGARRRQLRLALVSGAAAIALMLIVAASYYVASGNEQLVRLTARANS